MVSSSDDDLVWDPVVGRHVDVFYLALMDAAANTLLPEIYGIFGKETTLRFLERFEGTTITIPSQDVLKSAARKAAIYAALTEADDVDEMARDLANEHQMKKSEVLRVFRSSKKMVAGGV